MLHGPPRTTNVHQSCPASEEKIRRTASDPGLLGMRKWILSKWIPFSDGVRYISPATPLLGAARPPSYAGLGPLHFIFSPGLPQLFSQLFRGISFKWLNYLCKLLFFFFSLATFLGNLEDFSISEYFYDEEFLLFIIFLGKNVFAMQLNKYIILL